MEERLLRIGEAAEILGVDVMTLRRWDAKGVLVAQRTPNGHRRYNLQQLTNLLNQVKIDNHDEIDEEEVKRVIRLFARSLIQLEEQMKKGTMYAYPRLWVDSSAKLRHISHSLNGKLFPTTLDKQWYFWSKPLYEWGIPILEDIYSKDSYWLGDPILFDGEITDFCYEIASLENDPVHNEDLSLFKEIMDVTRATEHFEDYTAIRRYLTEHPTLDFSNEWFQTIHYIAPDYRTRVRSMYENIPKEFVIDGDVYLCPYCKWTLKKNIHGEFQCHSKQCRNKMNKLHKNWKPKKVRYSSNLRRIKAGILRYVVVPGVPELRIYKKLQQLDLNSLQMYPYGDDADISFEIEQGETWAVDVKDWGNAVKLSDELQKGVMPARTNWSKVFIIIPAHYSIGYIKFLQQTVELPGNVAIMGEREFLRLVMKYKEMEVHS